MKHPLFGIRVIDLSTRCTYLFVEFATVNSTHKAIVIEEDSGSVIHIPSKQIKFSSKALELRLGNQS